MGMHFAPDGEHSSNAAEGAFSAGLRRHAAADRLTAERERQLHTLRETGRGWEPFTATVVPALRLHQTRPTRTGRMTSAFESNDGAYRYHGGVLAMRQRILAEAAASDLLLPSRFEFAAPATIESTFRAMHQRGYFAEATTARRLRPGTLVHVQGVPATVVAATVATHPRNLRLIGDHAVPLSEQQAAGVTAWERDLGSRTLAEHLFVVSHAHDGAAWVPLDTFRAAERRILDTQEL